MLVERGFDRLPFDALEHRMEFSCGGRGS